MDNRGVLVFLASAFFFLILISVFVFAYFGSSDKSPKMNTTHSANYPNQSVSCYNNDDCNDGDSCTLNYCGDDSFCVNTPVVLCYQNDGCCPKGCTAQNDNDCEN
jgi:hypothetical protein